MKRGALGTLAAVAVALSLAPAAAAGENDAPERPEGANLVPNGGFESAGEGGPAGWQRPDGLSTFWAEGGPAGRGRCVRIDTDIYLKEWEEHQRNPQAGAVKTPTRGPKYDTVGGTKGVHFWCSAEIPVKRGAYYLVSVDARGRVVVTRWSGRIHLVSRSGEVERIQLPRAGGAGLYYTGVLSGGRLCATYCDEVTVVCQALGR